MAPSQQRASAAAAHPGFAPNANGILVGPPAQTHNQGQPLQPQPQLATTVVNRSTLPGGFPHHSASQQQQLQPNASTPLLLHGNNATSHAMPGAFPGFNFPRDPSARPSLLSSLHFLARDRINYLVVFVPIGILAGYLKWSGPLIFFLNFMGLIPLAKVLGTCTEELALYTNPMIGGLLNATLGNLVELLVSVAALRAGLTAVVQASLLGSVLSNLLLVLGFAFFFGGLRHSEQTFNETAAQTSASLLCITVLSFVLPAAFLTVVKNAPDALMRAMGSSGSPHTPDEAIALLLSFSRGTAIVMFAMYVLYLYFQLRTHRHLYDVMGDGASSETPQMGLVFILVLLPLISLATSVSAEYLVNSIAALAETWRVSPTFLGLVVIPIVGNAAEHVTAVSVAMKDKMDLAIGVAVGSSIQICLFVTPFCVIVGWILSQPMSLAFSYFETAVVFVSVFIVNSLIADGKSNWLEGAMLLGTYFIIALAFYLL